MTKEGKGDKERIVEPGELDVLCGRGGMSNHHPGNEWYRRLIKSNRPLYRACPKHTKLLVSKAIVQAVEQQGGRFLERNRNDGSWFGVSYKRAVDKTSQGLRERDRDDEVTSDKNKNEAEEEAPPPLTHVPEQFSGRVKAPNLSDLADVAIAHATQGAQGLGRGFGHRGAGNTGNVRLLQQQPLEVAVEPEPRKLPPVSAVAPVNGTADSTFLAKRRLPLAPAQQVQFQQQAKRTKMTVAGKKGEEEEDLVPLPPSLDQRESSMFRLLKQTRLLLEQSENWGLGGGVGVPGAAPAALEPRPLPNSLDKEKYPTKLNNLASVVSKQSALKGKRTRELPIMSQLNQMQQPSETQLEEKLPAQQQGLIQLPDGQIAQTTTAVGPYGSLAPAPFALRTTNQESFLAAAGLQALPVATNNITMASNYPAPPGAASVAAAPVLPLTRLTSQMSDWLSSFWPVAASAPQADAAAATTAAANVAAARGGMLPGAVATVGGQLTTQPEAPNFGAAIPMIKAPVPTANDPLTFKMKKQTISSFQRDVAPRIINVPPLRIDPVQINTIAPLKRTAIGSTEGGPPSLQQTKEKQCKRKSAPAEAQLQNGSQQYGSASEEPAPTDDSAPPAPTELEQSVSATLLQLAGTPSKLYTGFTSFFGSRSDNPDEAGNDEDPPPPSSVMMPGSNGSTQPIPSAAASSSAMVGTKRSSSSLLDDHEETPMEQRVRAASRKNTGSLL